MASKAQRTEIWLVDLGMVAKVRPCLVMSIPTNDENDRSLVALVPHTTSTRNSRFEVVCQISFLKLGAFDAQNLVTVPSVKLIRRLGSLSADQMSHIEISIKLWLGFSASA